MIWAFSSSLHIQLKLGIDKDFANSINFVCCSSHFVCQRTSDQRSNRSLTGKSTFYTRGIHLERIMYVYIFLVTLFTQSIFIFAYKMITKNASSSHGFCSVSAF